MSKMQLFDINLGMRTIDRQNAIVICSIILCFMITLGICFLYSGSSLVNVFAKKEKETIVYAIASGGYQDITLARQSAKIIRSRGGAGYVYKNDEDKQYELYFSVYNQKETAEKVRAKLGDKTTYIKEIKIGTGSMKWCSKDKYEYVNKALSYYDKTYCELYDIANKLSSSELTIEDAKIKVDVLAVQIDDMKEEFYARTSQKSCEQITEIKLALVTTLALLENIEYSTSIAKTISSIRYQLVQLVFCRQSLMEFI